MRHNRLAVGRRRGAKRDDVLRTEGPEMHIPVAHAQQPVPCLVADAKVRLRLDPAAGKQVVHTVCLEAAESIGV